VTRLPTLTATKVIRVLERAGFLKQTQRGSHAQYRHPARDVFVIVPVHPGDLPRWLLKAIIRQAGLTEEEFRALL
jgi:predicted RNA binding protein YcfA (HicA-like mRNA interferase family)